MAIKKIVFKDMIKFSTYLAIGAIRLKRNGSNIPILFSVKGNATKGLFTTENNITGYVLTTNSYSTDSYAIDFPFDTTKTVHNTVSDKYYWLSEVANRIEIVFDTPIANITDISYIAKPDTIGSRGVTSLTLELYNESDTVVFSRNIVSPPEATTNKSHNVNVKIAHHKYLVKNNGNLYTFNESTKNFVKVNVQGEISSNIYIDNGFSKITLQYIASDKWQELVLNSPDKEIEILYYTNDETQENAVYEIQINPYTLSDVFGEDFSLETITDDIDIKESSVEVHFKNDKRKALIEHLGDEFEIITVSEDANFNIDNLKINAKYTPLDELDGDIEVLTFSNEGAKDVSVYDDFSVVERFEADIVEAEIDLNNVDKISQIKCERR